MAMRESDVLTVATSEGLVRGTGSGVRVFRGIPYAAPPTGDLRWRAPRPREAWSGVRDATEFAPDAVQIADPQLRGSGMSEDCLYLNVWTPARSDSERLPVGSALQGAALRSQHLFAQPRPDTKLAPTHDDELPFVFGTLQNGGIRVGPESREHFNEGDAKLSKVMTAAWASFAARGNPNGGLAVGLDWPASETGDSVFTFGPMPGLAKLPRVEDLEFLRAYFGHKG